MKFTFRLHLLLLLALLLLPAPAFAAVTIPFTVTMSEVVNVTGSPRIAVDVGGVTRYAVYSAGTGSSSLTFTYSVQSGDVDADGVVLSSPIQLNGGSIVDTAGNPANLTYTIPNTSGIIVDGAVTTGYTAAFTADTTTNSNKTALSFVLTSPKLNRTYNYSISSSGGGTPVTGSGTQTTSPQTISGINVTSLPDGILTLSVTLTDSLGGVGVAATDTIPMAVLNANLVGHWTFDASDISGGTSYDRSGSGNNGTLTNGPVSAAGLTGNGMSFDGVNDYILVPRTASLEPSSLTLSAWVKFNSLDYAGNSGALIGFGGKGHPDSVPANKGWWFSYDNRLNRSSFSYTCFGNTAGGYVGGGNNFNGGSYNTTFTPGTYYHIALTVTSTQGVFYINGVQKGAAKAMTTLDLADTTLNMFIGRADAAGYYMNGIIDDFRIYSTALTAGQIATIYATH